MNKKYVISIDQSTQGTKALLFDSNGELLLRKDLPHRQIINEFGWVSHDANEIYNNTILAVKNLVEQSKVKKENIVAIGISNQRETTVLWDRNSGEPLADAIVWQCSRAADICERNHIKEKADVIHNKTGLQLSPYFPAAKISWLLENTEIPEGLANGKNICHGTIDSWLIFRLTEGMSYKTDYSNASRTQLFNIFDLKWDEEICEWFGVDIANLPEVVDSDAYFGETTFNGFFDKPIPIHSAMGDSHAALFGQACLRPGMLKATYGTGSSIMMNIGKVPILASGIVTSLAWSRHGVVEYVLEGNLNYTGAVITWLKNDMQLISSPAESAILAKQAKKDDGVYLVPAFTGLGAPYWDSKARATVVGMDRTTGRAEFVRAGVESIAYQIADVVRVMKREAGINITELRVDGGPTGNDYLMQFQSDILNASILIPEAEELSGIGAAYLAGMASGVWDEKIFDKLGYVQYTSKMEEENRHGKVAGWRKAVNNVLSKK